MAKYQRTIFHVPAPIVRLSDCYDNWVENFFLSNSEIPLFLNSQNFELNVPLEDGETIYNIGDKIKGTLIYADLKECPFNADLLRVNSDLTPFVAPYFSMELCSRLGLDMSKIWHLLNTDKNESNISNRFEIGYAIFEHEHVNNFGRNYTILTLIQDCNNNLMMDYHVQTFRLLHPLQIFSALNDVQFKLDKALDALAPISIPDFNPQASRSDKLLAVMEAFFSGQAPLLSCTRNGIGSQTTLLDEFTLFGLNFSLDYELQESDAGYGVAGIKINSETIYKFDDVANDLPISKLQELVDKHQDKLVARHAPTLAKINNKTVF